MNVGLLANVLFNAIWVELLVFIAASLSAAHRNAQGRVHLCKGSGLQLARQSVEGGGWVQLDSEIVWRWLVHMLCDSLEVKTKTKKQKNKKKGRSDEGLERTAVMVVRLT
jgi:hypothetical protein